MGDLYCGGEGKWRGAGLSLTPFTKLHMCFLDFTGDVGMNMTLRECCSTWKMLIRRSSGI